MTSSRMARPTPKSVELHDRTKTARVDTQQRACSSARKKIVECCGVFCSDQAQPPRQSECCAELGRKPSNGEPASPRTNIIFARLSSHKRGQCPLRVIGERAGLWSTS